MVAVGQAQIATFNWSFLLGQSLMPALNAVLLGTLMYQSRLVPRILPIVGLIGAPLLLAGTVATLFGFAEQYGVVSVTAVPIALWELSLGLWLTFKGFNRSSPLMWRRRLTPRVLTTRREPLHLSSPSRPREGWRSNSRGGNGKLPPRGLVISQ